MVAIASSWSLRASLFSRRLAPVEAVVVTGVRDIVLHDNAGSAPAPQACTASDTTQLRRTLENIGFNAIHPQKDHAVCVRESRGFCEVLGLTYHRSITIC